MNANAINSARGKSQTDQASPTTRAAHRPSNGTFIGAIGGFIGTLVMDLILMGALSAVGLPAFACFSIVGDTAARFFSNLGIEMAGGVPAGVATHYVVGPIVGAIFGAVVTRVDALRVDTLKKGIILAVLYVEILSQPILAITPIMLKMTTDNTLQWFGVSFIMHLVYGGVLGAIVSRVKNQ